MNSGVEFGIMESDSARNSSTSWKAEDCSATHRKEDKQNGKEKKTFLLLRRRGEEEEGKREKLNGSESHSHGCGSTGF